MIRSNWNKRGQRLALLAATTALLMAASMALTVGTAVAGVIIVKSDDLPQYTPPATAFRQASKRESVEVVLHSRLDQGDSEFLKQAASTTQPSAVFALGSRAAMAAREAFPDTPLVFAMALGWSRNITTDSATTGVSLELPAADLFVRFKLIIPGLHRIGLITSDSDSRTVDEARAAASELGLEILHETVGHHDEVAGAYRRMRSRIDALWMVPDPVVVTRENFDYLSSRCRNDEVAFLAFSENFVKAGALLSVAPSYSTMGSQAALLVEQLITDPGNAPPVQSPLGAKLVVNADTAMALGLDLDATTIHMADRVITPTREGF